MDQPSLHANRNAKNNGRVASALLVLSGFSACLAYNSFGFSYKAAVAALAGLAIFWSYRHSISQNRDLWFIIAAFVFSIVGDWFLSHRDGHSSRFVWGIFFFFLAHVGYLAYSLFHGRINYIFTLLLLVGYLTFYFLKLFPVIQDQTLGLASLLYLLISCISLGAAVGTQLPVLSKSLLVLGVAFILFSDTLIAFREFLNAKELDFLILPTYYLAQISVAISVLVKNKVN